jgi:hypothetical protein
VVYCGRSRMQESAHMQSIADVEQLLIVRKRR